MGVATFTTAGLTTWTPDADGTASVVCGGAGGGGGVATSGEGGGGGGAYSLETSFAFIGGNSYDVNVGAGGAPGVAGGDSWFDSTATVLAKGGGFGNGRIGGAGGAAASGVGDTKWSGGNGGNGAAGAPTGGGGSGSSAGTGGDGNDGGNQSAGVGGTAGAAPTGGVAGRKGGDTGGAGLNGNPASGNGSGGSGGSGGGDAANAGTGGDGQVIVTYTYDGISGDAAIVLGGETTVGDATLTIGGDGAISIGGESTAGTGTITLGGDGAVTIGGESTAGDADAGPVRRSGFFGDNMCAINVGPLETGVDLNFPVLIVNSVNEGVTGVADTSINIAVINPAGTKTDLTWGVDATWAEIDATGFEGGYKVTVDDATFLTLAPAAGPIGVWYILVYPAPTGAFFGLPCNFVCEIVNKQWQRFGPDFDSLFRRMNDFLEREGVAR